MLLERSELEIKPGSEAGFADAMRSSGVALLKSVPGIKSVAVGQGVENPGKFILLVEWDHMDSHIAYRDLPACPEFRALLGPYSIGGTMEHFLFD